MNDTQIVICGEVVIDQTNESFRSILGFYYLDSNPVDPSLLTGKKLEVVSVGDNRLHFKEIER